MLRARREAPSSFHDNDKHQTESAEKIRRCLRIEHQDPSENTDECSRFRKERRRRIMHIRAICIGTGSDAHGGPVKRASTSASYSSKGRSRPTSQLAPPKSKHSVSVRSCAPAPFALRLQQRPRPTSKTYQYEYLLLLQRQLQIHQPARSSWFVEQRHDG